MKKEIDLSDKKNLSTTIRSFALRKKGLRCYSEKQDGQIFCNAENFRKLWKDSVQNPDCIYMEKINGKTLCQCGDVKSEYNAEWFEANQEIKRKEAYGVYLGLTKF